MLPKATRPEPPTDGGAMRRTRHANRRGFTLIEVSLSLVILAVGVLAMVDAITAFRTKNAWSTHTASAMFMASEIRELTAQMPRHDRLAGGLYFDPDSGALLGWGPETDEFDANDDGVGDPDDYLLYDDIDDFDGVLFGDAPNPPGPVVRQFDGPIDAFGDVIPAEAWNDSAAPLEGWSQYVSVSKVDPNDFRVLYADDFEGAGVGGADIAVDDFPLRVAVTVLYQGEDDLEATVISEVSWIVPR
jgi:prepilin-type N-terminal cleavage/methylation domain-containing protein